MHKHIDGGWFWTKYSAHPYVGCRSGINSRARIPRYIADGELAINKLLAEKLFIKMRNSELERAPSTKVWEFRKAAWAIDELDQSILKLYSDKGIDRIVAIPDVDKIMSERIKKWLDKYISVKDQP